MGLCRACGVRLIKLYNSLTNVQIISAILSLSFFLFPDLNIEGLETSVLLKIAAYNLILIIYCYIGAYLINSYKRRQFADSKVPSPTYKLGGAIIYFVDSHGIASSFEVTSFKFGFLIAVALLILIRVSLLFRQEAPDLF